ncbi:DUF4020 domain-containing protein [Lacrimispora aerotolerans]|uniref:DUF4020 domain-containing protein n=1 Tax=Lacrimispora aerotolerans TaxID=36832 RepID=UPI000478C637|nr:DUF4020 domain-containing protein [Lacrimispora aerotolerans]
MPIIMNVDFPQPLFDAIASNSLVVFAGAGVSVAKPSNLMSFQSLAEQIASWTGQQAPAKELDTFLGKLEHDGVLVHESAAQILRNESGEPNSLHKNLVRLFSLPTEIRIITTNFDLLFEQALELSGELKDITVFSAPALPRGSKFKGIVHVHGDINHANDMVLTDTDFGRAYLTEGWARRFLVDVFMNYTILFIGYSYDDTVMKYLTRAMPVNSDHPKYILVGDNEDNSKWSYLNIKPIFFKNDKMDFINEYDSVKGLANRLSRGILDWNQRMKQFALEDPPNDVDFVTEFLQAMDRNYLVKTFVETTQDPNWFSFLAKEGMLDSLCGSQKLSERDRILMRWCVDHFIDTDDGLLGFLAIHDFSCNRDIAGSLGWALCEQKQLPNELFAKWIGVLFGREERLLDDNMVLLLLQECVKRDLKQLAMLLFSSLIRIELKGKSGGILASLNPENHLGYEAYCDITTEPYYVEEAWKTCFCENLLFFANPLIELIFDKMEQWTIQGSLWELSILKESDIVWNRQNLVRQRMDEDTEVDGYRMESAAYHLVTICRECMTFILSTQIENHLHYSQRMMSANSPLLRRLGIYSLARTPLLTSDQIVQYLMDKLSLARSTEKAELYLLFQLNYPTLSDGMKTQVLDRIQKDAGKAHIEKEEYADRDVYEWVHWLLRVCKNQGNLQLVAAELSKKYPHWMPRENPDLFMWSSSGFINQSSPISVEELLSSPPSDNLNIMIHFDDHSFEGPDREGLKIVISEAIQKDMGWSLQLAHCLTDGKLFETDLWDTLLQAWKNSDELTSQIVSLIPFLENPSVLEGRVKNCAAILLQCAEKSDNLSEEVIKTMHDVSEKMLRTKSLQGTTDIGEDRLICAIDSTTGTLCEFWIREVSLLKAGDLERRLSDTFKALFEELISNPNEIGRQSRPILCSQYSFLSTLDYHWSKENILPLFLSEDDELFLEAWHGFLSWGRIHMKIAEDIEQPFVVALNRFSLFSEDYQKRFTHHLTVLMIYFCEQPLGKLISQLFSVGGLKTRTEFAHQVDASLQSMNEEATRTLWNRWLKLYWEKRILQMPMALDDEEINIMIDWLQFLGPVFSEAVDIAIKMRPTKNLRHRILYNFKDNPIVKGQFNAVAKLLQFLAPYCSSYEYSYFMNIYDALEGVDTDVQLGLERVMVECGISKRG